MAAERGISYLSALQEVRSSAPQEVELTFEAKRLVEAHYPSLAHTPERRRRLLADLIADGRVMKILQGDQDLAAGQVAFTVIGHVFGSEGDGVERLEPRVLLSWSPMGTSSGQLDDPSALPLSHTFERAERATLLAARISYLDDHYFPGFGPLVARVTVNATAESATLQAVLIHETTPEDAREELVEGLRGICPVEVVPVDRLQPERIEPGPVTDSEVDQQESLGRLYDIASRAGVTRRPPVSSGDEQAPPDHPSDAGSIHDALRDALGVLPATHQEVIEGLHGLDGGPERDPREVGQDLGLSVAGVRRIEQEVLGQLRADPQLRALGQALLDDEQ
jgi:hypothetical protein